MTIEKLRPMLACKTPPDLNDLHFPVMVSPKLDGIRCLITEQGPMSRSMKPIRNRYVQEVLSDPALVGLDGELIVGAATDPDVYRNSNSGVMSAAGEPDFTYFVFDRWDLHEHPFEERLSALHDLYCNGELPMQVILHAHTKILSVDRLEAYESEILELGYEGLVTRLPTAPYKFNRSTMKEQGMVKIKRFEDAEAVVIGVEELMHNANEATENALGYTERSSHKENQVPRGVLGALVCQTPEGIEFKIGTGFTADLRANLWQVRSSVVGMLVKYKSFKIGVKDKPRHPVFLGFRDEEDM